MQIKSTLKKQYSLPSRKTFKEAKEEILGKGYDLSLVFCGDKLMEKLSMSFFGNKEHKNVLSFPLDKNSGEIFINIPFAQKEAKLFSHNKKEHILFLFIHGLLHLKGMRHSKDMEKLEEKFLKKFSTKN